MEFNMENFITEMFAMSNIPHHIFTPPRNDYEWLDFGLRTKLLGINAEYTNSLLNKYFEELPIFVVLHLTDIFQFHYIFMRGTNSDEIYSIGPLLHERVNPSFLMSSYNPFKFQNGCWHRSIPIIRISPISLIGGC